jgi:hypothetical protein
MENRATLAQSPLERSRRDDLFSVLAPDADLR